MIGNVYDRDNWNCTHEVSEWYMLHGYPYIKCVSSDEWGLRFVLWMRRSFTYIDEPEHGSLVVMSNKMSGGLHIGVWDNGMVHHCFQPMTGGKGQTIRSPLSLIKLNYKILKYGKYNGSNNVLHT